MNKTARKLLVIPLVVAAVTIAFAVDEVTFDTWDPQGSNYLLAVLAIVCAIELIFFGVQFARLSSYIMGPKGPNKKRKRSLPWRAMQKYVEES